MPLAPWFTLHLLKYSAKTTLSQGVKRYIIGHRATFLARSGTRGGTRQQVRRQYSLKETAQALEGYGDDALWQVRLGRAASQAEDEELGTPA